MHREWQAIGKSKNRSSEIDTDKKFLINQRKNGRPGCFGVVDTKTAQKEKRAAILEEQMRRKIRVVENMENEIEAINTEAGELSSDSDDVHTSLESGIEEDSHPSCSTSIKNRGTKYSCEH
uniref:Uncharacterized protein n=1 Tax=Bactrocera dorsalis TaxID=27457 RepID=A0A034V2N5_BACDO